MLPTHTVTHTGKRTDGAHGAKRFRPHPFCGKNARKALYTNGRRAFYHLVRMRSAVRIRPAAPKRKPPGRVVFCFGKLRCGVEVYPRRGKSSQQLQKFPPKLKCLGGFCYILQLFACFCNLEKRPRYQKTAFCQLGDQLFDRWKARNPLQRNGLRFFVFPSGIIGPGDIQGGRFTSMAKSFLAGRLPLAVRGGYDFVDVRDMTAWLMARKEKGEL